MSYYDDGRESFDRVHLKEDEFGGLIGNILGGGGGGGGNLGGLASQFLGGGGGGSGKITDLPYFFQTKSGES